MKHIYFELPHRTWRLILLFSIVLIQFGWVKAQTDFAPGEIMFTGYNSDDPDGFSIVILKAAVSGTEIYITDRGWSSTTGFRDDTDGGEGTIKFVMNSAYPCGTEFIFEDIGGANDWIARDGYGVSVGTVTILTNTTESTGQDVDGIEFNVGSGFPPPDGDELFVYQLPEPNTTDQSSFVCAIFMNGGAWNGGNGDDYSSQKPSGLADNQVVRFNTEVDNAKYDCTPYVGSATTLQAAITNDNGSGGLIADNANNWQESNNYINIATGCHFCCGTVPPVQAPTLSAPYVVNTNTQFTITITGTLGSGASWQLYTAGCGIGSPLQTTMSNTFTVTSVGTETNTTYYVRSSEMTDCSGICGTVTVHTCNNANNMNLCTNCNANQATCGDCLLPYPLDNPELDIGCYAMRIIFVLDESGSIGSNDEDVADGVLAFLDAINGQDAQVALIEFSSEARLVNDYVLANQDYIDDIDGYFNGIPYNGQTYSPNGGTNWHNAMQQVDALTSADLVLFFTDGVPTVWTQANGNESDCGDGGGTQPPEIVNPVKLANKIKSEGTHMFMLGVGDVNEFNLEVMSGFTEYQVGVNTLGTSDYSIGNFNTLAEDLAAFIEELCRVTIITTKEVLGPVCNGKVQFRFRIINLDDESAATDVQLIDTFPNGYDNPSYSGPFIKICFESFCDPAQPNNAFIWIPFSIPPLDTAELILTVDVLPTGTYVNHSWVTASNADPVSAIWNGTLTYDQPPTITCPANITIGCGVSILPASTGNPTGNNPEGTPPTFTYSDVTVTGSCPVIKTITRTWTATDNCLNTATCTQTIVIKDVIGPTITCPANVTVPCQTNTDPNALGFASATDACDATPTITWSDVTVAGVCDLEFTILRTWRATDDCNNTSTCVQTIFVDDNTPPGMTCPKNITINCTDSTNPNQTGFATATNNCGGSAVITYADVFVTQPNCVLNRTWTATDNCGNVASCLQAITMVDAAAPSINCPANVTINCTASTLPASTGSATSTDNCDATPTITYTDVTASSSCPQGYVLTRTWKSQDDCGNSSTCNQTISVSDLSAPAVTCPANITIQCNTSTLPAATGNATSTDNCDPSPIITFTDVTTASPLCPEQYSITRTWKSTDHCGNFNTCNQTITIKDTTIPNISCPANITILCSASTLPANTGTATGTDNCDVSLTITFTDVTIANPCPQSFTLTRTWKAQDDCGNFNTCNQTIVIVDNVAPTITCPANITIQCTASTLPANTGNPTSTDNCDASPIISFTDVTIGGGCPQAYTITRTWKSTDHCGNFNTCTQTITVIDNTAPAIICPPNITVQCTASTLPANTGTATSTDNCDTTPTVTSTDVTTAGSCPQEYTIARTWKAQDDCGNTSTCVQTITVDDSNAPVITCPASITIQCTASTEPANTGNATAIDNCDLTATINHTDILSVPTGCPQEYTITRTWTATDDCGNVSTCTQIITIDDSVAPVITCPSNVTLECTENTLPGNTGNATATDNCDLDPAVSHADVTIAGSCPQNYTINRTWTATDTCGNSSTCLQTILIHDTTLPTITCPANITIQCIDNTLPANTGSATATDNCDLTPDLDYVDITMSIAGDGYKILRTWTAVDACANDATCLQVITVTNPLNPEITGEPFDTICSGDFVVFQAEDQGIQPITYQWNFGSGSNPLTATGIGPHTVHYTYNATNGTIGAFVTLTVTTPGCPPVTDTVANVHVNVVPNAAITSSPGNPCVLGAKQFHPTDPENPAYTYLWNFGSGAIPATGTGWGPHSVEYFTSGSKTVQLIVYTNEAGASCGDTATTTFTVNICPGQITGRVFLPTDNTDTTGILNANVRLFADQNLDGVADNTTIIKNVFTNSQGRYSMATVTPGYYVIVETQPANYFSLWDDDTSEDFDSLSNNNPNDNIIPCTVEPNEIDSRNYFVEVSSPGIVSGYVFDDFDANEQPVPAEGIANVTMKLYTDNNADGIPDNSGLVGTTTTNGIGFFTIGGLAAGNYALVETQPAGFVSVKEYDYTLDGDLVPNNNNMNDTLPLSIFNAETDADNYFIENTPCSHVVTTINDNVEGSLRFAISCSNDWDTIRFHSSLAGQTLHLNAGRIDLNKNIYIHCTLADPLMIASDVNGAFKIESGKTVEFKNLQFTSGLSGFPGAQFENYGHLILWDVEIFRNSLLMPGDYLIYNNSPGELTAKGSLQVHN